MYKFCKCSLLTLLCWIFVGCAGKENMIKFSDASTTIKQGMTLGQVMSIISPYPIQKTFEEPATALQFCQLNGQKGFYVIVWLMDGVVEGVASYTKYVRPKAVGMISVGCEEKFRTIVWDQAPTSVRLKLNID